MTKTQNRETLDGSAESGDAEMLQSVKRAWKLGAPAAVAEDPSSGPSTHVGWGAD